MGIRRLVVAAGKAALRAFPEGTRQEVALRWRRRFPVDALIAAEQASDPERLAVLPYCVGQGLDIGCGCAKTTPEALGVDLVPKGELGRFGSQVLRPSAADVCASGDAMPNWRSTISRVVCPFWWPRSTIGVPRRRPTPPTTARQSAPARSPPAPASGPCSRPPRPSAAPAGCAPP